MESHALKIDRSLQAGLVVDSWEQYRALPSNRSDLQDWDTKYSNEEAKRILAKKHLTPSQRRIMNQAQQINRNRPYKELKHDLRTTENVQSLNKEGFDNWKKDPNKSDMDRIDTHPTGLIGLKTNYVRKRFTQVKRPNKHHISLNILGYYRPSKNEITLNKNWIHKKDDYNRAYAHELGHSIDYTKFNLNLKLKGKLRNEAKSIAFKINPIHSSDLNYLKYRHSNKEIVADFFSGYITNPKQTKKEANELVRRFNQKIPNLHKNLLRIENRFLKEHIRKIKNGPSRT